MHPLAEPGIIAVLCIYAALVVPAAAFGGAALVQAVARRATDNPPAFWTAYAVTVHLWFVFVLLYLLPALALARSGYGGLPLLIPGLLLSFALAPWLCRHLFGWLGRGKTEPSDEVRATPLALPLAVIMALAMTLLLLWL